MAMWTMRRSYGLSGPISCGMPDVRAFSAMNAAICFSSASLSRRKPLQSITMRLSSPSCRRNVVATRCCSACRPSPPRRISTPPSSPSRLMRVPSAVSSTVAVSVDAHRGDDALDEAQRSGWSGSRSHVDSVRPRRRCGTAAGVLAAVRRLAAGGGNGGPIIQFVKYCWPMAQSWLTNQYSTTPLGENAIIAVNMTGMIIMTRCCVGSAVVGVIFCCQNIVTPISSGSTKIRIGGREIVNPADERRAAQLDRHRQQRIERQQHRHREQHRHAAARRVDALLPVQLHDLRLHLLPAGSVIFRFA